MLQSNQYGPIQVPGPITALPKMLDKWEEQMDDDFPEGGCK